MAELADSTISALLDKTDKTRTAEFLANAANYGNRNVLDDLKDEEIPPELRDMIRSEIRSFRTNAAIRDLAKEESSFPSSFPLYKENVCKCLLRPVTETTGGKER